MAQLPLQRIASFFNCYLDFLVITFRVFCIRERVDLGFFSKLFGKKRGERRISARLRVTIGPNDAAYWTEDVSIAGIRMHIGKQLSLEDLTGGSRDVLLSIELEADADPILLYAEPIWTVRADDGQLSAGWMFSRYEGDGKTRLAAFIDTTP